MAAAGLVGYVTDVEGDLEFWRRYVEASVILNRGTDGKLHLADGAQFVFGGDAVGVKAGDLEVLEELVALKCRYPDRVHLIVGNRDANKLRLRVELSQAHREAVPLREHPGPYWNRRCRPTEVMSEEELTDDSAAARLRWILRHSMGEPDAFENRRKELSRRREGSVPVHDVEVVDSFLQSLRRGGVAFEYLANARLAVLVGGTLFLHAGLPRSGNSWVPGWVPPCKQGLERHTCLPVAEWLQELDRFLVTAIAEYAAAEGAVPIAEAWSLVGGYVHMQPGSALLQYIMRDMPDGTEQPSVVYNGWLHRASYQPLQPDEPTLAWLREGGVRCIVSGHLPYGDAPLVLQLGEGMRAITADTSYAASVTWEDKLEKVDSTIPGRGQRTVCEILLGPDPGNGRIHGVLANGVPYEARLDDDTIGRVTSDGWRVKAKVGGQLLLCKNESWDFMNRLADPREVSLV